MQTDEQVLRSVFKTANLFQVPRPILFKTLINSLRRNGELYLELFCANPDHPVFRGEPESMLAPMRLERMRRAGTAAEKYKLRKCKRAIDKSCPFKDCPHAKDHERQNSCLTKPKNCGGCE